jgi:hypothetical protein
MWIEKLADGVLEVDTPIGKRYIRPDFKQRVRLLWTFRNFDSLPQQVLSSGEQRLIDRLCREHRFVAMSAIGDGGQPVIGRVERRLPMQTEALAERKPAARSASPMSERGSEAVSA